MSAKLSPILALLVLTCTLAAAPRAAAEGTRTQAEVIARTRQAARAVCEGGRPSVQLVTMGTGSLIWERHGHIALCLCGTTPIDDACYNYGLGDFSQPVSMGLGFFRGQKSFWVGKLDFLDMLWIYVQEDRAIWAQTIPLDADQRAAVVAKLEHDIREENRFYAYDHFVDNCTTRVRDILDTVTHGALSAMPQATDGKTFRDLARDGFVGMAGSFLANGRVPLLITDIAMGRSTDRVPTAWERMFLPQYLREGVAAKWGTAPREIYKPTGDPQPTDGPSGRIALALLIVALTAPAWLARRARRYERAGLAVALALPVLLGLVLWLLAIISPLPYVRWNESLFVFFPVDALLVVGLRPQARVRYAQIRIAMLALDAALQLVGLLSQPLLPELLWPLIPALVVAWPRRAAPAPAAPVPAAKPAPGKRGGKRR